MGLYQVCLENYTDINDIKRIIARANMIAMAKKIGIPVEERPFTKEDHELWY